jgi:hypothetical protein
MERVVRMLLLSCFLSPDFVADDHSFFLKKKNSGVIGPSSRVIACQDE